MMSLHRSMHSSQMYTPGPAISFLTCFCDFPQNEHLTRSLDSPNLATPNPPGPSGDARSHGDCGELSCADHFVDNAVGRGLGGAHNEIAVGVAGHFLDRLAGVGRHHLVEQVPHTQDLLGLDLYVRGLARRTAVGLMDEDAGVREGVALALSATGED